MHIDYNESLCMSDHRYAIEVLSVNLIYLQKRIIHNVKKSMQRYHD